MNRPQLFNRALGIMFRSGSLWLVALPAAALNVAAELVLPGANFAETIGKLLVGLVVAAFLTGALISLVNAIAEGGVVSAGDGFTAGARTFLPLLLIGLVLAIPSVLMGQILDAVITPILLSYQQLNPASPTIPTDMLAQASLLLCCLLPLVLLAFVLVALLTGALGVGAERSVALEGQAVWGALKRGWGLLLGRFSDFLVIGLIMLGILAAVGILFGCPAVLVAFFASGVSSSLSGVASEVSGYSVIFQVVIAVLGIPLGILFSGVWTLAFRRWQGKDAAAPVPAPFPPVPPEFPGT